jgi:hypothetical protein
MRCAYFFSRHTCGSCKLHACILVAYGLFACLGCSAETSEATRHAERNINTSRNEDAMRIPDNSRTVDLNGSLITVRTEGVLFRRTSEVNLIIDATNVSDIKDIAAYRVTISCDTIRSEGIDRVQELYITSAERYDRNSKTARWRIANCFHLDTSKNIVNSVGTHIIKLTIASSSITDNVAHIELHIDVKDLRL